MLLDPPHQQRGLRWGIEDHIATGDKGPYVGEAKLHEATAQRGHFDDVSAYVDGAQESNVLRHLLRNTPTRGQCGQRLRTQLSELLQGQLAGVALGEALTHGPKLHDRLGLVVLL